MCIYKNIKICILGHNKSKNYNLTQRYYLKSNKEANQGECVNIKINSFQKRPENE